MIKRKRRSRKKEAKIVGTIVILAFCIAVLLATVAIAKVSLEFFRSTNGKIFGVIAVITMIAIIFRKITKAAIQERVLAEQRASEKKRVEEQQRNINNLIPSTERSDYLFEKDDYRRGNPKENLYKKAFSLRLFETFHNKCAKCGTKDNGVDIDHFLFSKNEGGCFMMRHRDGYLVNNAIPLCHTCNRSKSDDSYKLFFRDSELALILEKNVLMTKLLNECHLLSDDGKPIKIKKAVNG
ncbi:MAG: hypothetical protein ACXVCP_02315 [Bdellovibrio sp.]